MSAVGLPSDQRNMAAMGSSSRSLDQGFVVALTGIPSTGHSLPVRIYSVHYRVSCSVEDEHWRRGRCRQQAGR